MGPVDGDSDCVGQSLRDDPHFEELRSFWSKALRAYGPQWMIIVALQKLDDGEGALFEAVAAKLNVDPSFVTTHSRLLVRKGFVSLRATGNFEEAVRLSLTGKAQKYLAEFAARQRNS